MNKLFTKIASLSVGLALAIGVGVSIGSREARHVHAAAGDDLYSSGQFSTVGTHSYTQNKTFTLASKSWTASVSQVNNSVFYLGCNSNNASKGVLNNNSTFSEVVTALRSADSTYNSNYTTSHAYALLFENAYNTVGEVTFTWNGGNNAFQIYLFGDKGSGYVLLDSEDYATSGASISGSVSWTASGDGEDFTKFAIAARPGTAESGATNKTLRPGTFVIKEGSSGSECEHSYGDWVVTKEATCTEAGSRKKTCSKCGYELVEVIDALGHDYVTGTPVAATCTEGGYTPHTCSRCGDSYHTDETDALGHNYVNGVCTRCGAEEPNIYVFKDHYSGTVEIDGDDIAIDSYITAQFNKRQGGSNATAYYENGYAVRWYGGGTLVISGATGVSITSIIINYTQTANSVSANVGTYSLSSLIGTWTGEANSVTFTQSGTTGQCRIYSIEVVYSGGTPAVTYTVSFDGNNGKQETMSDVEGISGEYTLPDPTFTAPSGQAFTGWKAENEGDLIPAGGTYTVEGDVTFYAQWATAYTVTYEAGTHATGSYAHTLQPAGTYKLLAFANLSGITIDTGYRFKNYTVNGVTKNPNDTFTLSSATTVTVNFELIPMETTYNFVTNFGTYAKDWGTSYSSKTLDGVDEIGGAYEATITLPYGSKQTSNITTMPVVADQSSGDVIHISFELTESGYELNNVSVTFAQWTTKAPTMKLFKGTTATGDALDTGVVGTKNTISATNVGGTTFVVAENDGGTSRNQVGISSIYISLKPAPVLSSVTTSGQKDAFAYGETFSYGGTLTAHYTEGKADATVSPSIFKYGATADFDADNTGTAITVGASLSHATHDGVYVKIGYSEDSGTTYKWTTAYQISVEDEPDYYMILDAYTDTGTDKGYKGGIIEIDVTDSVLAGNINWSVTAGSVTDASGDNTSYMATLASVGTLTIVATDTGDNTNTHTITITVYESLNTVMAASNTPHTSSLVFTAKAGGSGTADDGATYSVTSDAEEAAYEEDRGIHFGTNNNATVQYVQLSSSNVASGARDTIRSITVNASDAQTENLAAQLTVTVGGESFHCGNNESVTLGGQASYTFTGTGSGTVVIRAERSEARYKGIFVKSVVVNYVTASEEKSNIADAVDMHLAQKAVIDFAKDFNDTLEEICVAYGSTPTATLSAAWSGLATQYDNWFNNGAKELTTGEIDHAKALFANASSVDRNVTASADELQHMLAKYDWIVSHYGYADFLNTDAGTGRGAVPHINGRLLLGQLLQNSGSVIAVIAISAISLAAVGGYFLFRKKKED